MHTNLAMKDVNMNGLRGRVIKLYKEKNLTMKDVAEAVGVKLPAMSKYLSGRTPVRYEILIKMAEFFDVDVAYLTGESNIRRQHNQPSEFSVEMFENLKKEGLTDEDIKEICDFSLKLLLKRKQS